MVAVSIAICSDSKGSMNSNHLFRHAAAVVTVVVGSVALAGTSATAAGKRPGPTTTTTTTTVTAPPTTASAVVPAPTSFTVANPAADSFAVQMSPATQLGGAELLSGPTVGGPAILLVSQGGLVSFLRLTDNSDYVFRYRNGIASGSSIVYLPWVTFSFHTPADDSLRPSAPQNVRVISRTATLVTVTWDVVPSTVRYDYSVNGGASFQTGVCSGAYCDPTPLLSATIARPAPGTAISFSVTASRSPTILNCSYCFTEQELLNRFNTSLPATITVTN